MPSSFAPPEPEFLNIAIALEQIGDAQAMQGMLGMLEESLARDIPLVTQLLAAGDVRAANRVLHGLKGFIPIFCVDQMCRHVAEVEELSKTADRGDVTMAFNVLRPELEHLRAEVAAYLNGA